MDSHNPFEANADPGGQALPVGYELDEYVIEKEIGAGGFGVTYKAHDRLLDRTVAIKEYFPFNLAARNADMRVSPKTRVADDVSEYEWGLSRFIQEARTLAIFEHPAVIRVIRYIERNGTAYIIMEFADGKDVSLILQERGPLSVAEVKGLLVPIADGLASVHAADMLHRDIKPGNIRVRENGQPILIDFGAARQAIGARSRSISTILTPGYAPIEQYSARGNQGPWTDIYALAAVAYVALTGENLGRYEATERIRNDTLPKIVDRLPDGDARFLAAIDWALCPEESDRPQSIAQWREAIDGKEIQPAGKRGSRGTPTVKADPAARDPMAKSAGGAHRSESAAVARRFPLGAVAAIVGGAAAVLMGYLAVNISDVADQEAGPAVEAEIKAVPERASAPARSTPAVEPPAEPLPDYSQDDKDFDTAVQINTAEAFEIYLRLHPKGRHQEQARSRPLD